MKSTELRQLDLAAIAAQLSQDRAEYFAVRESIRTGKEKNHARLRFLRRDIARAQTLLQELQSKNLHSKSK